MYETHDVAAFDGSVFNHRCDRGRYELLGCGYEYLEETARVFDLPKLLESRAAKASLPFEVNGLNQMPGSRGRVVFRWRLDGVKVYLSG